MRRMARIRRLALLMIAGLRPSRLGATGQERPGGVRPRPPSPCSASRWSGSARSDRRRRWRVAAIWRSATAWSPAPTAAPSSPSSTGPRSPCGPPRGATVRQAQMEGRQASRIGVLVTVGTVWARVAGWLGGRATVTIKSDAYSATAHDGLIGAQQQPGAARSSAGRGRNPRGRRARRVRRAPRAGREGRRSSPAGRSLTETFAVDRGTIEITTSGAGAAARDDAGWPRLAGFVPPGIDVNQVFGSAHQGGAGRRAHGGGAGGPLRTIRRHADRVGDGPFTVAVVGRDQGAVTTGTSGRASRTTDRAWVQVVELIDPPAAGAPDPRTTRAGSAA